MAVGTDNYRTSTLTRHIQSSDHKASLVAPQRREEMRKAVAKPLDREEKAILVGMKVAYWLAQEGLPLSKYGSLIRLLKFLRTPDIEGLSVNDRVNYESYYTATELVETMSDVFDTQVTEALQKSPFVTILTDESTDIAVHHKLSICARTLDPETLAPTTHFLTDVRLTNATGAGIFEAIKMHLGSRKVQVSKVMGLGTDGASVMTGRKTGLAGQFLRVNPHIENTRCSAHRVALVSEQAANSVPGMVAYRDTIVSLYYYFHKSAVRSDRMKEVQAILEEPVLRYREVHQVRWLSFYKAIEAVWRTLDSLITYFSTTAKNDPKAAGIGKKIGSELFISITYALMDILQPIMRLNLFFQQQDVDIGSVKVNSVL